jgi:hypothetical protein
MLPAQIILYWTILLTRPTVARVMMSRAITGSPISVPKTKSTIAYVRSALPIRLKGRLVTT